MAVYKQRRSNNWWYKFNWNGVTIRESTKQTNKRTAEQIEAAHKTSLAKGEVGIRSKEPSPTASGHIEASSLKKQHTVALKTSGVETFVLYTLRHTCLTRWAKHMDPFTLHVLAGHTDMNTTKRYVHPNEADIREAMSKVWHGHTPGHTSQNVNPQSDTDSSVTDRFNENLDGATRRDRTGDLLITN